MRLFVNPILDYECYAQEPVEYKFLFWKRTHYPNHKLKLIRLYWSMMWWNVDIGCEFCNIEDHNFGFDDAEIMKAFKLKKLPEKKEYKYYKEKDLEELK